MTWKNKVIAITPFICTMIFMVLWLKFDLAHPGWIVFLFIPIMPVILGQRKISIPLVIVIAYIIIGIITKEWHIWWIILLLIPIINILKLPNKK